MTGVQTCALPIYVVKQKDGDKLTHQVFTMSKMVLGHDEDNEEISSLSASHNDAAAKILANAAQRLSTNEQIIMSLLTNSGSHMLDKDLRHSFYNQLGQDAVKSNKPFNQETAKKAYYRAFKSLSDKNMAKMNAAGLVSITFGETE